MSKNFTLPHAEIQIICKEANELGARVNDFIGEVPKVRAISVILGLKYLVAKLEQENELHTAIAQTLFENSVIPGRNLGT